MSFTKKALSAAVALLVAGGAHATIQTFSVGNGPINVMDPDGSGRSVNLELLSGSGTLTFSNPGVDYAAFDSSAIGGAVGALNTGMIKLSGGDGITAVEQWKSYAQSGPGFENVFFATKALADADPLNQQYYDTGDITAANTGSFRLASAASAQVNSISAKIDNIGDTAATSGIAIGSVVTAISSGYALQSATANAALTGGNIRIENIVFDLYNGTVNATVSGARLAFGKVTAATFAPQDLTLWTFQGLAAGGADISGPSGFNPADLLAANPVERLTDPTFCGTRCYELLQTDNSGDHPLYDIKAVTNISNLAMTDAGINFFKTVLNTNATGTAALLAVNSSEGKWGSVQSELVVRLGESAPVAAVPEASASAYALMGLGLVGISLARRRRRQQ